MISWFICGLSASCTKALRGKTPINLATAFTDSSEKVKPLLEGVYYYLCDLCFNFVRQDIPMIWHV